LQYLKALADEDKGDLSELYNLILDGLDESPNSYIEFAEKSEI